jgi:hypothetical protein
MQRFNKLLSHSLLALAAVALQACGGGGGGGNVVGTTPINVAPITAPPVTNLPTTSPPVTPAPPAAGQVRITGQATFESVTNRAGAAGLDYGNIATKPMRGVLVLAVATNGATTAVIGSATTSDTGAYALNVPANTNLAIAVAAVTLKTTGPANWNVGVYDNTDQGALWQIEGPTTSSGAANSTRDIKAPIGWNPATNTYTAAQRASGPFAILDTIYTSMQLVTSVAPTTQFPQAIVFWSPNNSTAQGDRALGEIGTSFFTEFSNPTGAVTNRALYILGKEGNDTDEFDSGVIAHEYGHYLQSAFSQNHSTGGPHSTGNLLDMTLSYGEGWGYAFASLARNNPANPDSNGAAQANGFVINTGTAPQRTNNGWFSETSVQYIIYKFGVDNGFAPIWAAFNGPMKSGQDALNTIFSFAAAVRSVAANTANSLNSLLAQQSIFSAANADQWGTGETNNGGNANNIPVHQTITVGGPAVPICFNNFAGDNTSNKLGERRYLRFTTPAGSRTITASFATGGHDIDFEVFQGGKRLGIADSENTSSEVFTGNFIAGEVVVRAVDFNINGASPTNCATIKVN